MKLATNPGSDDPRFLIGISEIFETNEKVDSGARWYCSWGEEPNQPAQTVARDGMTTRLAKTPEPNVIHARPKMLPEAPCGHVGPMLVMAAAGHPHPQEALQPSCASPSLPFPFLKARVWQVHGEVPPKT